MANNRMFLVYRPTGDAVFLGKRMGYGWYGTPADVQERILKLFDLVESKGETHQDDFAIALEDGEAIPHAIHDWVYGRASDNSPLTMLVISKDVPTAEY